MMRFAKSVFKPFIALYALVGVGLMSFIKYAIVKLKIESQYKHISKLNAAKNRLYRLVFSPYRISNGIRPVWAPMVSDPVADIQHCHEIVSKARLARSAS